MLEVNSPWPKADLAYTYALVPKEQLAAVTFAEDNFDAIVPTPCTNPGGHINHPHPRA